MEFFLFSVCGRWTETLLKIVASLSILAGEDLEVSALDCAVAGDGRADVRIDVYPTNPPVEGHYMLLVCIPDSIPHNATLYIISWMKNCETLPTDPRFKKSHHYLDIDPVKQSDSGTYQCVANLTFNGDRQSQRLVIEENIRVQALPTGFVNVTVWQGQQVILNCSVAHFSSVRTVIWKRDGTTVIATDRVTVSESLLVLGLASVHVADAGFYKCEVEDQLTHFTANMTFRLAVLGRLAIDSITTPQTVLLNTRLLLKCTVSGFPQPRVTWHHTVSNGCNVEREKCYMVKSDGNLLLTITLAQMGRYYCMANNTIQKVEKMTNVSVIQETSTIVVLKFRVPEGRSANVSCGNIQAIDDDTVRWIRGSLIISSTSTVGERLSVTAEGNLLLRPAIRNDTGDYQCAVRDSTCPFKYISMGIIAVIVGGPPGSPSIVAVELIFGTLLRVQLEAPEDNGNDDIVEYVVVLLPDGGPPVKRSVRASNKTRYTTVFNYSTSGKITATARNEFGPGANTTRTFSTYHMNTTSTVATHHNSSKTNTSLNSAQNSGVTVAVAALLVVVSA